MMQSQQIPMTFQRYETKYMLSPIMARKLRKSLPGHLQMDEYGLDTICSLYYDTPDHQLIRRSLEKPVYKEKLRLRSYGPAKETSPIYVELKKKYEGIVYKRRERMILSEAVPYLAGKSEPGFDSQILHEITWFRNYYRGLAPAMYIAYDRIACFGTEDRNFRVTFDTNIRWRTDNLCLDGPTEGTRLLEPGWYLMEVKTPGAVPLWFSKILDDLAIYPASFSKYGFAYQIENQKASEEKEEEKNTAERKRAEYNKSDAVLPVKRRKKGWKIATALGLTAIVAVGAVVFCVKSGENMEHPFVELYGDSYEILTKEKLGHTITITDNGLDW